MISSVILAGFQTTVQDCGRVGLRKFGVTPGGALDSVSLRLANLLVGNPDCMAGLECSSGRVRLKVDVDRLVAWAGGEFEIRVGDELIPILHCARLSAGAAIEISPKRGGRAWLAISGGVDVPEILEAGRPIYARTSVDGQDVSCAMAMSFPSAANQDLARVCARNFLASFPIGAHRDSSREEDFFALFAARIGRMISEKNCSHKNSA